MGEALYYNFAYLGGIIYLQLYLWIIFPQIFITFQGFFGGDSQILQSPEHEAAYRSLLTNVAPIGFIYIFGAYNKYLNKFDRPYNFLEVGMGRSMAAEEHLYVDTSREVGCTGYRFSRYRFYFAADQRLRA